jgi:uncharacterized damage-inducible protein DinB
VFSQTFLTELYRHMEWADATVWQAVPLDTAPDQRLRGWLVHIHVVQRAFLHVWTNQPIREAFREPDEFETMADVRSWAQPYYREASAFVAGLTPEQLAQPVVLPWAAELAQHLGREPGPSTLGDTCFQVTSHSTYHRGQVNARLREIGAEPPLVDYIAWLWFDRPEARWKP